MHTVDTTVLAGAAQLGNGAALWIGPLVISLALVTALLVISRGVFRAGHPVPHPDQSPHRGPIEGGLYHYRPGMYAHSFPPAAIPHRTQER